MPKRRQGAAAPARRQKRSTTQTSLSDKLVTYRSEIELFQEPPFDVSLLNSFQVEHYPVNTVSDKTSPITFTIQGSDQHYMDLRNSRIYVRGKIVRENGTAMEAADVTCPTNTFLHSMFSQCTIWLNETQITPANMYYGYRAYIDMLLGYGKEYKKSQAQCSMYFREKSVSNTDAAVEDGFKHR
jgi:hypothetical protein